MKHHPNFFLVGVVKGGTTSLHNYLDQHPDIYMSPVKEVNYFSRFDIRPEHFSKAYAHDVNVNLRKYLASDMKEKIHIAHVTDETDYLRLFGNVRNEKAIGEASNSYLLYPRAPEEIHKTYPEARILMMLRHPAERAYSQYIMNLRLGKTLETDFLKEVQADNELDIRGWGANHQYLYIGKYHDQVKRYLDLFPRDQILICFYEDYRKDAADVMRKIYQFLEVDPTFKADTERQLNTSSVPKHGKLNYWLNQSGLISWAKRVLPRSWRSTFKQAMYTASKDDIPEMTTHERSWLIDYYREDIQKLSVLLDKDLSGWLE